MTAPSNSPALQSQAAGDYGLIEPIDSDFRQTQVSPPGGPSNLVTSLAGSFDQDQQLQESVLEELYGTSVFEEATPQENIVLDNGPLTAVISGIVLTSVNSQLLPPEPVAQLYYNPFNAKYEEEAWLYNSNVLSKKNPWHNSYADFNLESRAMAQNYGLVAEFRISEHMDQYLLEDSGDFQGKNYNVFSVEGASYDVHSNKETRFSGKTRYTTEKNSLLIQLRRRKITTIPREPTPLLIL